MVSSKKEKKCEKKICENCYHKKYFYFQEKFYLKKIFFFVKIVEQNNIINDEY